jgi:hypothetical protein
VTPARRQAAYDQHRDEGETGRDDDQEYRERHDLTSLSGAVPDPRDASSLTRAPESRRHGRPTGES